MFLLHYLSYAAILAGFAFMTLSLASGLLYVSELIEEHSRLAKVIGQRAIYGIIFLHVLLYFTDSLPLPHTLFSIVCHAVYLQNFSSTWPLISLSSFSFVASCVLAISDHFIWFFHFSRVTREARQAFPRYRGPVQDNAPGFSETATFFGVCVWLVPLFLFLSLSANDNALPMSSGTPSTPTSAARPVASRSNSSLFKSMFNLLPLDSIASIRPKAMRRETADGLIAPHSPNPMRRASSPVPPPSPTPMRSPYPGPPPRTPSGSSTQQKGLDMGHLSPSNFRLGSPPHRAPQVMRRATADSSGATMAARRTMGLKAD
ncbi:DUF396-domain-containing protein [Leucogyrophana mollusca]|uniref:DUF396-domain-containing protein n=1 Tax=Leucogyrophana mollusca TaxID=85980 RepID=A0ACB8BYW9_9AGAM|nr:DUF396-domain-containing protein [Leucogyrophana mollusca]